MTFDIVECDADATRVIHWSARPFVKLLTLIGDHVIQSVDRAIRVLTALQGARRMSLSELAARLKLAPSTTHGIVRTLVEHGMVVQERGSSRYQLGPAVLRLGNVYLDTLELRSKTIPWAEDLARRTGLAVRTGVLLIDDVVIIHHEPRPDGSRQMPEVGIVIPVHASALGKAMLAFLPDDEKRVLTSGGLRSMTGETLTSPDDLREQLDTVRSSGVAAEHDEAVLGESALASPVFDSTGDAIGAIGVVIASGGELESHPARAAVRETARALSRELGAQTWPPRPGGRV
jgi:DNA-binding IclR family transcriptional regulator